MIIKSSDIKLPPRETQSLQGAYSPTLSCHINAIQITRKITHMYFPLGNNCDKDGATQIATQINPSCKIVLTYSGPQLDTCYFRTGQDAWDSINGQQFMATL
jgi:hypothetical protein